MQKSDENVCQILKQITDLVPDAVANAEAALRQPISTHLRGKLHELIASLYRVTTLTNEICGATTAASPP